VCNYLTLYTKGTTTLSVSKIESACPYEIELLVVVYCAILVLSWDETDVTQRETM